MPYLHWELDHRREAFSEHIDNKAEDHRKARLESERELKKRRRNKRQSLVLACGTKGDMVNWVSRDPDDHSNHRLPPRTLTELLDTVARGHAHFKPVKSPFHKDPDTGKLKAGTNLGQVLLDAARLSEVMSNYRDKMLIDTYLSVNPPLHPRRTLDQAYYWNLKSTKARDKDQVVYRETAPKHLHAVNSDTKTWTCHEHADADLKICHDRGSTLTGWRPSFMSSSLGRSGTDPEANGNTPEKRLEHHCPHCGDNIRKVSRVVMVDQLWMWILDEHTIITCFPRRYGVNRKDSSGVHKSIRTRLKYARTKQIRSVFDLALIILDECSNSFFDRTKNQDKQPQAMDIFSEAIGAIVRLSAASVLMICANAAKNVKQTLSFNYLWFWADKLAKAPDSKSSTEISAVLTPLLNVSPEGMLQREIKDIIDELDIMIRIARQQKEVLKDFKKHVEKILDPDGDLTKKAGATGASDKIKAKAEQHHWFAITADDLVSDAQDNMEELSALKENATSTAASVG
jgi:hypothetical protein